MRTRNTLHSISGKATALLLGICVLAVPAIAQATQYGAESPEALQQRLQKAAENQDFGELAACIAPDDRAQMTMMMVAMAGFFISMSQMGNEMGEALSEEMSEDEQAEEAKRQAEEATKKAAELEAQFKAILEKHGAAKLMDDSAQPEPGPDEDPAAVAKKALEGVDQVALLKDLFALMESVADSKDEGPMPVPAGELKNLQIDGDRATAMIEDEEVEMVRIDGRWYIRMPMD